MVADSVPIVWRGSQQEDFAVRKLLLSAVAIGGFTALCSFGATAAPVVGAVSEYAAPQQHVVQAQYYWHHHHWHHRRWYHGGWRYY
jgi:hypothetical protein